MSDAVVDLLAVERASIRQEGSKYTTGGIVLVVVGVLFALMTATARWEASYGGTILIAVHVCLLVAGGITCMRIGRSIEQAVPHLRHNKRWAERVWPCTVYVCAPEIAVDGTTSQATVRVPARVFVSLFSQSKPPPATK